MIRRQSHWYVLGHSLSFFQNDFAGRIAQKVVQMGPAIRDFMVSLAGSIWFVAVSFLSSLIIFYTKAPVLTAPLFVWLVVFLIALRWIVPKIQRYAAIHSEAHSQMVGRIVDSYTNIQTVKLFARSGHEDRFVIDGLQEHKRTLALKNKPIFWLRSILYVLNFLMITGVLFLAVDLWQKGEITPGALATVLPLSLALASQAEWIAFEVMTLFEWLGQAGESMETIARPHGLKDAPDAPPLRITQGHVKFENIRFHYGHEHGVIENLNLEIPAGQKIGLIGRSGAGKSTLVALLLRFYDLQGGRILIDGQDIAQYTQESLRQQIAMVTQDTSLLHRSIRDNIRYGRPDASEEEIIAAAEKAKAWDFIPDLQDTEGRTGLDALVGERGVKLSGGQRQRIAIARVILKDAPILILDEATSALDSEVEAAIQSQLKELMQGKTVIAIAHRLSTIAHLDRLVVMEDGEVVEDGTHKELLDLGGIYNHLWNHQSGGFLGER